MIISIKEHGQILYDVNALNEDLLNGVEILIGREEDCHIQLDSYLISRYHAKILQKDGETYLEVTSDYGGVYRNGASVSEVRLQESDKLTISDYELVFSNLPEGKVSRPLDLQIDEAFSKTQLIDKVKDETVLIPAELEEMMAGDSLMMQGSDDSEEPQGDYEKTEMFSGGEELEENIAAVDGDLLGSEPESSFSSETFDDQVEDQPEVFESDEEDFTDEPLDQEFEASEDFEEDKSFNSELGSDESEANTADEAVAADGFGETSSVDSFNTEPEPPQDNFGNDDFASDGFTDDEFANEGFGETTGAVSSEDTSATQVYQSFAKFKLKIFGEYAPLDTFLIEDSEVKIGRDEECDIILNDPEVSKVHAIIKKTLVNCVLMDNDSSNGIIWNGERTKKVELTNGDEFLIGDTTFTVEVKSDIIEAEKDALMPVEHGQEVEIEEIVEEEVDFDNFEDGAEFGQEDVKEKSFLKRLWKNKRSRLYLIVGTLVVGVFLLPSEDSTKKSAVVTKKEEKKELKKKPEYSERDKEILEQNYSLALERFQSGNFSEAKEFLDIVERRDPDYKDTATLSKSIEEGVAEIKRIEEQKRIEKERQEMLIKVKSLVEKARKAVDEKRMQQAKNLFNEILKRDPENIDVPSMKLEVEYYESEQERKKMAERIAKEKRDSMVNQLKPGKAAFLKEEWYDAVEKLETFIQIKDMDDDLVKEATSMLKESRLKLKSRLSPLISKARSYKEGQDLKQAYETYGEVLKLDPGSEEALNERDAIFRTLENRSKKAYREALIAESLSLYAKAKEKFEEVKQISPDNSEYYRKSVEKLRNYLE